MRPGIGADGREAHGAGSPMAREAPWHHGLSPDVVLRLGQQTGHYLGRRVKMLDAGGREAGEIRPDRVARPG